MAAALAALALAPTAFAGSYELVSADVLPAVQRDGTVEVEENIRIAFGDFGFTYGFREIPYRKGERVEILGVSGSPGGPPFRPGASTELEPGGPPGTYGTRDLGGRVRVVWRFQARNETRTFTIRYRIAGLAVGYDDVVDVNLKVWGDEWEQRLGQLTGWMVGPATVVQAWGHPVWVSGDVEIAGDFAVFRAVDVPAGQYVELRALYPRSAFSSTSGMRVVDGNGLQQIVDEEQEDAASFEADQDRIDALRENALRTALIFLALAAIPALVLVTAVWAFFGRELRTGYDREYEQEPPTDTEPALVPVLLGQGSDAGSFEWTATLFDLIRRGVYRAEPVTTERKIWAGLRTERISDLELSDGEEQSVRQWEDDIRDVVDAIVSDGPERLSRFRDEIEDERASMSKRFQSFKEHVTEETKRRLVQVARRLAACGRRGSLRRGRRAAGLPGRRRLAARVPAVLGRDPGGDRRRPHRKRGADVCDAHLPSSRLAAAFARRTAGSRALERLPPLPHRLSAAPRGTARDIGALGALPRLRNRVRDRGARAARRAHPHAGGVAQRELDLLDLALGRSGIRSERARDRRPGLRLRRRARATELGLGRIRRRVLGWRWGWRRRRRRRVRLALIWLRSYEETMRMDPKKRKRIEERHAEWLRTDPLQQRLRERIEYHKARAEAQEQAQREDRRESS